METLILYREYWLFTTNLMKQFLYQNKYSTRFYEEGHLALISLQIWIKIGGNYLTKENQKHNKFVYL